MEVLILLSTRNSRIPAVLTSHSLGITAELHCQSPRGLWHFSKLQAFPTSQSQPSTMHL